MKNLNRRQALGLAAGSVAALGLAGCEDDILDREIDDTASGGKYAELDPKILVGADNASVGAAAQVVGKLVAQKVAEKTGNRLYIDYFPSGELGGDTDNIQGILDGNLDLIVLQTAPSVSYVPAAAVFDLPMVFAKYDGDTIEAVLNGDSNFRATIDEAFAEKRIKLMGFLQNATYRLTTSNTALNDLSDFKGLQIRTLENNNHMAFWTAIGAAPTPITWGEVFICLQNHTIDAEENAADTILNANLQEVQDYLCCTNHILYLNEILMSKDNFDALDPLYQEVLIESVEEAIAEYRPELVDLDLDCKDQLANDPKNPMTIIEYDDAFFDEVLNMSTVQDLYDRIDADVDGLGTILQDDLESYAS